MAKEFRPKTSSSLAQERKLKQLITASKVSSTDRTKFEDLCKRFRNCCLEIREVANWPKFRGSFDECVAAMENGTFESVPKAQELYNKLNAINSACRYEGEKLGYQLAEWWMYCWKDEFAEEANSTTTTR